MCHPAALTPSFDDGAEAAGGRNQGARSHGQEGDHKGRLRQATTHNLAQNLAQVSANHIIKKDKSLRIL